MSAYFSAKTPLSCEHTHGLSNQVTLQDDSMTTVDLLIGLHQINIDTREFVRLGGK